MTTEQTTTEMISEDAHMIVGQMSADDVRDYTPEGWRSGISDMEMRWDAYGLDELLDAVTEAVETRRAAI